MLFSLTDNSRGRGAQKGTSSGVPSLFDLGNIEPVKRSDDHMGPQGLLTSFTLKYCNIRDTKYTKKDYFNNFYISQVQEDRTIRETRGQVETIHLIVTMEETLTLRAGILSTKEI